MKIPGCWKANLLEICEHYHGLIPYFTVTSLLLRNRMTVFYSWGCYLQGHSARSKPISIMPGKCVLAILHPANTHPPCEHSTGIELCPDKQIDTDCCLNDVSWAWLSCWHLLTTQDACSLLQQLLFFPLESVLKGKYQVEDIFLVNVFQDAAWPRSIPRTEAVKQRNPYRVISSMSIAALATSHAVRRMSTNQNKTTRNRKAELCTQGAASDSTSSPSGPPQLHTVPLLPWNTPGESCWSRQLPKALQVWWSCAEGHGHSAPSPGARLSPRIPCLSPASQDCGMLALKHEIQLNSSEIPLGDRMGQSRVLEDPSASALLPLPSMTEKTQPNKQKSVTSMNSAQASLQNHLKKLSHYIQLPVPATRVLPPQVTPTPSLLWVQRWPCWHSWQVCFLSQVTAKRSWNQGPVLIRAPLRKQSISDDLCQLRSLSQF